MRKVIGGLFLSVDGVMQAPGGPREDPTGGFELGGWAAPHFDETLFGFLAETMENAEYDLLLGRKTYEIFAAHWPYQPETPLGAKFDQIRKYVVTATPDLLTWQGSEALVGDPAQTVAALKRSDGPDLVIQGSSELYPALLGAGLVDRLWIITLPVLLGKGKRPFGDAAAPTSLRLVDHRVAGSGAVVTVYERAGAVPVGDFEMETPSDAELARRDKMMREG